MLANLSPTFARQPIFLPTLARTPSQYKVSCWPFARGELTSLKTGPKPVAADDVFSVHLDHLFSTPSLRRRRFALSAKYLRQMNSYVATARSDFSRISTRRFIALCRNKLRRFRPQNLFPPLPFPLHQRITPLAKEGRDETATKGQRAGSHAKPMHAVITRSSVAS